MTIQGGIEIQVAGTVQGVGFRPFVHRLAREEGLTGWVRNGPGGVAVAAFGPEDALNRFRQRLISEAPPLARVDRIACRPLDGPAPAGFTIAGSASGTTGTAIAPDAAVCRACLAEMHDPAARRHRYPFLNCTHCGPRFSIVEGLPYDRERTAMRAFPLCAACRAEFEDPPDRRFHAQVIACPACGPRLWLEDTAGRRLGEDQAALAQAIDRLTRGQIVAIKGLGGFHLACRATDGAAILRLRARKARPAKPFALMVRDAEVAARHVVLDAAGLELLCGPEAPIVLAERRRDGDLPDALAPGLNRIGVMLPYTPLHALLLAPFDEPLVMTSGNPGQDPQITDTAEARERLACFADVLLLHDRGIVNRVDDSLVQTGAAGPQVLRRARGLAPAPIPVPSGLAERHPPALAIGGDIKTAFAIAKAGSLVLSQHIGDLANARTRDDLERQIDLYCRLYGLRSRLVAIDRHPGYVGSRLGRALAAAWEADIVEVDHHHAHAASCMVQHGLEPDTRVLALVQDGLGFGPDGTLWGAELLCCDLRSAERLATLKPAALPGGDRAAIEPWRNLLARLHALDRSPAEWPSPLAQTLRGRPVETLCRAMEAGVNAPPASSAGRLFDAVAAALGLCPGGQSYEGEAAMRLQALAEDWIRCHGAPDGYPFAIAGGPLTTVDPAPLWDAIADDLARGAPGLVAARFHVGWAEAWAGIAGGFSGRAGAPKTVVLSGGVFCNRLLSDLLSRKLSAKGLRVLQHASVPANDGGLAIGQLAIALALGGR